MMTSAPHLHTASAHKRWWVIVLVFYVVALAGAAGFDALQSTVGPSRALVQLTQLGPALGVVVVLVIWRGASRPVTWLRMGGGIRTLSKTGMALLAVVLSFVLAAGALLVLGQNPVLQGSAHWGAPVAALIVAQLLGAAAEEVGWRGLLQPMLEARWGRLSASIVVGILWGAWHVPTMMQGWLVALLFLVSTVAMSITIGELIRGSRGAAVLVATVFHTAINLGLLAVHDPRLSAEQSMFALAVGTLGVALIAVAAGKAGSGERR